LSIPGDVFGDAIHRYTRREAIADGVLVDVTREASPGEMAGGFAVPVAITAAVSQAIEAIPASLVGIADARGRLHDVLWMAVVAARRCELHRTEGSCVFRVHMPSAGTRKVLQVLTVQVGPGDAGEPVVTIGFPEEV